MSYKNSQGMSASGQTNYARRSFVWTAIRYLRINLILDFFLTQSRQEKQQ